MNRAVPAAARQLAAQLQEAFAQDQQLARQLGDAQQRLQSANARLWSGLHPNALALLSDDTHAIGIGAPGAIRSEVAAVMINALQDDAGQHQLETTVLRLVQEIHWTIHGAFTDYQTVSEQRRQLAADTGEVTGRFTDALVAAGWSEDEARNANVDDLSEATEEQQR
jgi:hypothetical protein